MLTKKTLVYIDILGFDELAKKEARNSMLTAEEIRKSFLYRIQNKIKELEEIQEIERSKQQSPDSWLLFTDDIWKAFKGIDKILTSRLSLEIAVGVEEFSEAPTSDDLLHLRDETLNFLKNDILSPYKRWYKEMHNNSIKESFIVLTNSAYSELEHYDKKVCKPLSYKGKDFFVSDMEKINKRLKVLEFLKEIGLKDSKIYNRIDDIYVPPEEYEDIKRTFEKKRIVFITGVPEYGKTYTAVRLMWEYYIRGYTPKWIFGKERKQREFVRESLEEIRRELKPKTIVYFEDPFGKTIYEKRESLEREIRTIIDTVNICPDAFAVITSREEVFKEFKEGKSTAKVLRKYEKQLNMKKLSYDYDKRKEILLSHAEKENCKWLKNENLKNSVIEEIKDKSILPTPLSVRAFAIATANVEIIGELKKKIKEKSEETVEAFAEEIKNMKDDKILFLSLVVIYEYFAFSYFKEEYEELVKILNISNAWEFDRVLNWFIDDKIEFKESRITFSHPSYLEAFEFSLMERYTSRVNEIFSNVLSKLYEEHSTAEAVAYTIAKYFDRLSRNIRKLLFEVPGKDDIAFFVLNALGHHRSFPKLPRDIRGKLLCKFLKKKPTANCILSILTTIGGYFDLIIEDERNELLLKIFKISESKISGSENHKKDIAGIIAWHWDKLPKDKDYCLKQLLLSLLEDRKIADHVKSTLQENNYYSFESPSKNSRKQLNRLIQRFEKERGANLQNSFRKDAHTSR